MRNIRNIGIFAHVDAGKTTLSERLLMHAGAIRTAGSVDAGTAHTDDLDIERRRGISVRASCVRLSWKGVDINLIDTPGHVDFSAEVERSLWALDGAVLVVCGVEGVQPQTQALFEALREQGIPTVLFINKMDREGADAARVTRQARRMLSSRAVMLDDAQEMAGVVCEEDEALLSRWLEGEALEEALLRERLCALCREGKAYPVLAGSALRDQGVETVLDAVVSFLPAPPQAQEALCGVVFALMQHKTLGRGAWVRLYGGSLENRQALETGGGIDPLTGEERRVERKITQIKDVDGTDIGKLRAGEIGVVYGLGDIRAGYVLGDAQTLPRHVEPGRLRAPLITVKATPEKVEDMETLREACRTLSGEDPLLSARYARQLGELQLNVMGMIQLEILQETLKTRFGLNVLFSKPAVIYKETIAQAARGFVAYTMPKPCWAVLGFELEPAPRGSGVTFASTVPVRDIMARYQHQVKQALPLALSQGRLGWEVTDVKITLTDGNHHLIHTHPLDFIVATPMAIQDGLRRAGSVLIEPVLDIRFLVPPECVGRVMSDVALMRGEVLDSQADPERAALRARVPVATSLEYSVSLASFTGGRGTMSVALAGYRECPVELGATDRRRGVDPLDTSRYILAARSALEGGIFDE